MIIISRFDNTTLLLNRLYIEKLVKVKDNLYNEYWNNEHNHPSNLRGQRLSLIT